MADKVPTINLMPNSGSNFASQFFNWALTIGRLLIILTEMVALGTFIYRFGLDQQIVNLHDKIKAESSIVNGFKDAEITFRDIQDRLATVKRYTSVGNTTTNIFTDIVKMGQGRITFKDLTVNTQTAKIIIIANNPSSLTDFVTILKKYPSVTSISVDKVENDTTSAQIIVSITAGLKTVAFEPQITGRDANGANQTILSQ